MKRQSGVLSDIVNSGISMPRFTDLVAVLSASVPFVGPEAQERARKRTFKARIGANESVFGPSPKALRAMKEATEEVWQYGDPENHDLLRALASHYGIKSENIVVGEGIDGLLGYLVRMLVKPGVSVVTSRGAYPTFSYHVAGYGGTLVTVPYTEDHENPHALVAMARKVNASLVYLANPDNPMGTWNSFETVADAVRCLPHDCLLVLDEAYIDCAPPGTAMEIDVKNRSVIRMRTFSKAYGMAGARVGYAIGHEELMNAFNKVRNHFGMCRISQAGALAALRDREYLSEAVGKIAAARKGISDIARGCGLEPVPSAANFVAIDCGADGAFAKRVLEGLIERDIFVRMPFVSPQNRCIRISAGTDADLELFKSALPQALEAARLQVAG